MSRGLGWMQLAILAACDEWRKEPFYWRGGEVFDDGRAVCESGNVRKHRFDLPDGVIDLRGISKWLAKKQGRLDYGCIRRPFQASFSRAARQLKELGYLQVVHSASFRGRLFRKCYPKMDNAYACDGTAERLAAGGGR